MDKILITGASGFIGRNTLEKLCDKFEHVYAIFLKEPIATDRKNLSWHKIDLLSFQQVSDLFQEISPTHLLHLAWYAEPGKYGDSEINIEWLSSSLHLIKKFREAGGQRVVCAGTCFEYDLDYGFLSEDKSPLIPDQIYGVSKKSLYEMVTAYSDLTGLSCAWGRVFYMYGPAENPRRLVASIINSLLKNQPAKCSSGEQMKDYLHVFDVADAFVQIVTSNMEGAVNIGSGQSVSVKDIVLKIGELTGNKDLIQIGAVPSRGNEKPLILADVRKLTNHLSWQPRFNLDEGLKHTIDWWENSLARANKING